MLLGYTKNRNTQDLIIEALHRGEFSGPALLEIIAKSDKKVSKETFYRIIRQLTKEEVINKQNKHFRLNRVWLQKIYQFSKINIEDNASADADHVLSFTEGEKIIYKFKNINQMGVYWTHIYDIVYSKHDKNIPILVYHPHEWLIHTRKESEKFFLSRFQNDRNLAHFAIGGNTPLDKQFKNAWSGEFLQIATGIDFGLKNTEYINVIGNYIFRVTISKKFCDDMDKFFKSHDNIDEEGEKELLNIFSRKDRAKMIFTKSKKESQMWHTRFKKYFFTPPHQLD